MKERTREHLKRFLVVSMVLAGLSGAPTWAADACGIVVDETESLSETDRLVATSFIERTIFDYIDHMGCSWIMVSRFSGATRFSPRTWIEASQKPAWADCERVKPEPLTGHRSIFNFAGNVVIARKRQAVETCQKAQTDRQRQYLEDRTRFLQALEAALAVTPKKEYSRITEYVQELAGSELYRHMVIVSDLLDNPKVPLNHMSIPDGLAITIIAVQPNPKYGTRDEVLSQVQVWEGVSNVSVVTTGELHPRLWGLVEGR